MKEFHQGRVSRTYKSSAKRLHDPLLSITLIALPFNILPLLTFSHG